jgi:hypothetical protein
MNLRVVFLKHGFFSSLLTVRSCGGVNASDALKITPVKFVLLISAVNLLCLGRVRLSAR